MLVCRASPIRRLLHRVCVRVTKAKKKHIKGDKIRVSFSNQRFGTSVRKPFHYKPFMLSHPRVHRYLYTSVAVHLSSLSAAVRILMHSMNKKDKGRHVKKVPSSVVVSAFIIS